MNQKLKAGKIQRIFLSYGGGASRHAQKIKKLLLQHSQVEIFTAEDLSAGEKWESRIKNELQKCDMFLVILSPESIISSWVLYEVGAAWAMGKPIVAVATDPTVAFLKPLELSQYSLIDIDELRDPGKLDQVLLKAKLSHPSSQRHEKLHK